MKQKSIGFNLTSLSDEKLSIDIIEKFNKIIFGFFDKHNLEPTYWGVDGKGFGDKLTKFTQKKLQNLKEEKNYLDRDDNLIEGIDYIINPKSSDKPAFDSYFEVGISYSRPNKQLEITFIINPNIINTVSKKEIGELVIKMVKLFTVDFGFIYEHEIFEHVSAVVINYDDDNFTKEELEVEDWWYSLSREEKLEKAKQLYPVNLLRKELYHDNISKILADDKEFFEFYHYKGDGFVEMDTDLKYLECLVDRNYLEYCK